MEKLGPVTSKIRLLRASFIHQTGYPPDYLIIGVNKKCELVDESFLSKYWNQKEDKFMGMNIITDLSRPDFLDVALSFEKSIKIIKKMRRSS